MRTVHLVAIAIGCLISTSASAKDKWSRVCLGSACGAKINLDYKVTYHKDNSYKPTNSHIAAPVFVNVSGKGIKPSDKVRVVLKDHTPWPGGDTMVPVTYVLDLKPSQSAQYGQHFSGDLRDSKVNQSYLDLGSGKNRSLVVRVDGYGGTYKGRQGLAVVVNGRWLTDPVNKTHTFNMNLYDQR